MKISFILIFLLVIGVHAYIFSKIDVDDKKVIVAHKQTSSEVIQLKNVVIKKQEIKKEVTKVEKKKTIEKIKPKIEKKEKIVKKASKKIPKEIKKVVKNLKKEEKKELTKKISEEKVVKEVVTKKLEKKREKYDKKYIQSIENEYLLRLKELIEKNKVYPNIAKRLGQTGKVYISFTILKNGFLKDINISKNSKYKRLNIAAKEIFLKINKFDSIPKELNKNSWEITVPIVYQISRS